MTLLTGIALFIAGGTIGAIVTKRVMFAVAKIALDKRGISPDEIAAIRSEITNEDGVKFFKLVFKG